MAATHKCAREGCMTQCSIRRVFCSSGCNELARLAKAQANARPCAREGCSNRILRSLTTRYCSDLCRETVENAKKADAPPKVDDKRRIEERLLERVTEHLATRPNFFKPLAPVKRKASSTASPHEMVLMLSDAHFGEVVDPETAMGLSYGTATSLNRLQHVRDVVLRYKQLRESSYPVRKLTIAQLGDMLSGDIHDELEITNEVPLAQALVQLAYALDEMYTTLADEFDEVEVIVIPGNHPRATKVPRFKQKTVTNYEYILGHFIASLAGEKYTVQVPKDLVYVHEVCGKRLGMTHGDGVQSNSFAGIPFYGIRQRQNALQSLMRHLGNPGIDYLLMGHFHTPTVMVGTDSTVIINGAIKGGDEYSIGTRLASTDPVQLLLTYHEKHGLTDVSQINLKAIS